ncbi:ATP-binding protein [Rhizobium sp. G21]|uniref:ATP-binding protein n=1 Tax=Rhizobium sp. G21 TaxID=2758439 RepID=UPI001600F89A|nr:ATP-binding protein [Rhizobium sp. G21]MBB1249146.1 ATP-binding protein [Rhizobium sp. G21]
MKTLADVVRVERRFALSARLDSDLSGTPPLTGYVLQPSVRKSLETMVASIYDGGQRAFTWTGPYGGGKSCAALLVANLVAGAPEQRVIARTIAGPELTSQFGRAFTEEDGNWAVLALTGRRANLAKDLAMAAANAFNWPKATRSEAESDDRSLISQLETEAKRRGGLLLIIDELGKFFEHAIAEAGDLHMLQDLAERANRSGGKLVIIGVLHQSFEQYASKLNRTARDEWAKVQGRFQNVPFVAQADEVAALLARAITVDKIPSFADDLARKTAEAVAARRPVDPDSLADTLRQAWPLHPITALLLGPVSRQRFAQNERSVFGFLSSAEPYGFQAHLMATELGAAETLFRPDQLWDYLVANFGSALSVGPDGARMTLAMEAIERAALRNELCARLTKAAALIEFFRNGSGLAVSDDFLRLCMPTTSALEVDAALSELVSRAILIKQPRLGGYALFAGSDFDLDEAMRLASEKLEADALTDLPGRLGIGPIAAKRHYFQTGALRTFDVLLQFGEHVPKECEDWARSIANALSKRKQRTSGALILLLPDAYTFEAKPEHAAQVLGKALEDAGVLAAVAIAKNIFMLREHATDLYAVDRIEASHPQLEGDRIARRELSARRSMITDAVRKELLDAFSTAKWWQLGERDKDLDGRSLSVVASVVSNAAFYDAPVIQSELLNRDRPSSSAMAGLRALMHAMVQRTTEADLGITGFPAERGLYLTILRALSLHRQDASGAWRFHDPNDDTAGKSLHSAWKVPSTARRLALDELYDKWSKRPYGMKRGVMPILALAFLITHRATIAVYVDGLYEALIDDVFVDRMLQEPKAVEFRRVVRSKKDDAFVLRLATLLSQDSVKVEAEALPVASALYQRFHALPLWSQRTLKLPLGVTRVRDAILRAKDPEALLFSDLVEILKDDIDPAATVAKALATCETAYPAMLETLKCAVADHLGVDKETFEGLGSRAVTAAGVTADLRLDAFAMRAGAFEGEAGDIEGLASLLVHKPPRSWSDREHEQALFELAKLSRRFREAETFAGVKGRAPTSQAISVMVGLNPKEQPVFHTFEVTDKELEQAEKLADEFMLSMRGRNLRSTVELAALARIVERLSTEESVEVI